MNADDIRDLQIERYIHNKMNAEERLQFEMKLQQDDQLKSEVDELLEMKETFDSGLVDFKKKLVDTEEELERQGFFEETKVISIRKSFGIWWAVAASIILVAGVFYFFNHKTDLQQLTVNATLNDFSQVRGTTDELDSLFELAVYQPVIDQATQQFATAMAEQKIRLSLNITRSYILIGKPEEAVKFINGLPEELKQNCDLQYTLALAYLFEKERAQAKNVLNRIIESKCFPQELHAGELLKKI